MQKKCNLRSLFKFFHLKDTPVQNNFFIIGLPRSGTTMLEQMLDAHSKVAVCPEISSGMAFSRMLKENETIDYQKGRLLLNSFHQWAKSFDDPIKECLSQLATTNSYYPLKASDFYNELMELYLTTKKAEIFGEKTPENLFYIPTIKRILPQSKYIVLLRNPLDVLLSMCECLGLVLKESVNDRLVFQLAPIVKKGLNELYNQNNLKDQSQIWINYEELIANPEPTLNRLCQFLGIKYEQEMMDFQFRKKFVEGAAYNRIIHKGLDLPITNARIDRYKQVFTKQQIYWIYQYLLPEIQSLPYEIEYEKVPLSIKMKMELGYLKMAYRLRFHDISEFRKRWHNQIKYQLIKLFEHTLLGKYFTRNLKWDIEDWV